MQIAVVKELHEGETRVPFLPESAKKLADKGAQISVEAGIGISCNVTDQAYMDAGATVEPDRKALIQKADILLRLRKPPLDEIALMKQGAIHISYLDPFNEPTIIDAFKQARVTSFSMELIPRRFSKSQKMDALSSQASLAGYVTVLLAANEIDKALPMMTTPAGTIQPARVFIIGVGVAGLQAIATAKRLGARVEAFDTRPVVEEQVKSLGAKFVKVDLGETGQTEDGYAKQLTDEQMKKQQEAMEKVAIQSDIVITTAQLFGRKAPRILTKEIVSKMKPGSVIVDMAVESGGNVEGSEVNKNVNVNGVTIIGLANLPAQVARDASRMYSNNIMNFVDEFWDKEEKTFKLDINDEFLSECVVTHDGEMINEKLKK